VGATVRAARQSAGLTLAVPKRLAGSFRLAGRYLPIIFVLALASSPARPPLLISRPDRAFQPRRNPWDHDRDRLPAKISQKRS
jgi:hypothetical protein